MIENLKPDVVITDIVLPGLDGISLIRKIREKDLYPIIVIITENPNNQITKIAYKYGAQLLILKPFDVENLAFQLRDLHEVKSAKKNMYSEIPTSSQETYYKRRIEKLLSEIGIPTNRVGYRFLVSAFLLELGKPNSINAVTKTLYPVLAKKYQTSPKNVERAIHYVINVAWCSTTIEGRRKIYGNSINPQKEHATNREFLTTVIQILRRDGIENIYN